MGATVQNLGPGYDPCYWRTAGGMEVDFVLYRGDHPAFSDPIQALSIADALRVLPDFLSGEA